MDSAPILEHSNSRFESLRESIRFVKKWPFDSLVVKQFFLLIYCIIFSCHLLFKRTWTSQVRRYQEGRTSLQDFPDCFPILLSMSNFFFFVAGSVQ